MKPRAVVIVLTCLMLGSIFTEVTNAAPAPPAQSTPTEHIGPTKNVQIPVASYRETSNTDGTTSITYTSGPIPMSRPQPKEPRPTAADIEAAIHPSAGWYGPWGPGCYWTYTYMADRGGFGQLLTESWVIVNNWCFDGIHMTSDPWSRTQCKGYWGWGCISTDGVYSGWVRWPDEWSTGATAHFLRVWSAPIKHRQWVTVFNNGWRYTS